MFSAVDSLESSNLFNQLQQREHGIRFSNSRDFVSNLYRERLRVAKNLYKIDLRGHYGCVNAIEFSHGGKYLASGGDDKRVLVWDIERVLAKVDQPRALDTEHSSNIFCLGFDRFNNKVLSGGNDDLVIVHDFETGKLVNVFKHDNPVYGLSIDPQCESVFATACEDGQILVFDQRADPADPLVVAQYRSSFHAVEFHPAGGKHLVTANSKRGAAFWDIRKPKNPVIQYGSTENPSSSMSVRFNTNGSLILALRRRLPPIMYNTQSPDPVCTFFHSNYYNSCTMKSCTFAGEDDELVLSGSDDFNLYVWRVSDVDVDLTNQWIESTQMVLYGHRSIVNQVRYNREKCILASSGVEKIVKLWSPFNQKNWVGKLLQKSTCSENPRELYSPNHFTSLSTSPHSWSHMSHDYSSRNTNEDPRMMSFFDSLIQQEIEGWETNSTSSSDQPQSSSHESSDSNNDDNDDDDNDDDGGGERVSARTRCQTIRRKARKQRKPLLKKVKVQRHKFSNRIAYLIATKRNTLRRMAMRGASLNSRRLHKIVKVVGKRKRGNTGVADNTDIANGASTSAAAAAAAAAASSSSNHFQRRKTKNNHAYDSSTEDDDDDDDTDDNSESVNTIGSSSGRFNVSSLSNNTQGPSTSTGITSSLKDDILSLRRQQQNITDSDEDDDDDDSMILSATGLTRRDNADTLAEMPVRPTKKLNGVRRTTDATTTVGVRSSSRLFQQASSSRHSGTTSFVPIDSAVIVAAAAASASSSSFNLTTLPRSSNFNGVNHHNNNGRRRGHANHASSRVNANNAYPRRRSSSENTVASSYSASSRNTRNQQPMQQLSQDEDDDYPNNYTPVKRRKMTEYNEVRREWAGDAASTDNDNNNNESFNNNNNNNTQNNNNSSAGSNHNFFNSSLLHTPDSGISVTNNMTPQNNIDCFSTSNSNSSSDEYRLLNHKDQYNVATTSNGNSNAENGITDIINEAGGSSNLSTDASTSAATYASTVASTTDSCAPQCIENANNRKTVATTKHFQQKVARVRRNCRKKFAKADSESD